jgi:hypothetical protein
MKRFDHVDRITRTISAFVLVPITLSLWVQWVGSTNPIQSVVLFSAMCVFGLTVHFVVNDWNEL